MDVYARPMQHDICCDRVRAIRRQSHRSWVNIWQAVCELQGLEHESFGTAKVAASSKACVERMLRDTGLTLPQLEECLRRLRPKP